MLQDEVIDLLVDNVALALQLPECKKKKKEKKEHQTRRKTIVIGKSKA